MSRKHVSNMSEKKETLLNDLYNTLQSPEFHCLKEINQSLYSAHELMMKQLDQQEEHNKISYCSNHSNKNIVSCLCSNAMLPCIFKVCS